MEKFFPVERLKKARLDLIEKLGLENIEKICLIPQEKYDLIINSGKQSIHECAEEIKNYLFTVDLVEEHLNLEKQEEV